jgi:predicted membrane chloride channel (bestrophin family)
MTPRPVTAVFSFPLLLVSLSFLFSPFSVLAIVLATYPAYQSTTDSAQTWEEQAAY